MFDTRYFLVSGRVQGVGFRAATRQKAEALELDGWVRNCADGRVEVLAAGSGDAIQTLRDWLGHGPGGASVTDIAERDADEEAPAGFSIR